LVDQTLGNFVGALIVADLLSNDEDIGVRLHLLSHCGVESVSDGDFVSAESAEERSE